IQRFCQVFTWRTHVPLSSNGHRSPTAVPHTATQRPERPMNQPQMPPPGHPRPQKQGMSTGKKFGLGCGGLFLMLFLLGGCVAVLSGGSTDNSAPSSQANSDTEEGNTETSEEEKAAEEEPEEESEIVLTAETREFNPSILHDSGAYTSVFVTVENNSDEDIEIN